MHILLSETAMVRCHCSCDSAQQWHCHSASTVCCSLSGYHLLKLLVRLSGVDLMTFRCVVLHLVCVAQVEESAPSVRMQLQEARAALRNILISDDRYHQLRKVCTVDPHGVHACQVTCCAQENQLFIQLLQVTTLHKYCVAALHMEALHGRPFSSGQDLHGSAYVWVGAAGIRG